jgi:hypothetical protein
MGLQPILVNLLLLGRDTNPSLLLVVGKVTKLFNNPSLPVNAKVANPSISINLKVTNPSIPINLKVENPYPLIQEWVVLGRVTNPSLLLVVGKGTKLFNKK